MCGAVHPDDLVELLVQPSLDGAGPVGDLGEQLEPLGEPGHHGVGGVGGGSLGPVLVLQPCGEPTHPHAAPVSPGVPVGVGRGQLAEPGDHGTVPAGRGATCRWSMAGPTTSWLTRVRCAATGCLLSRRGPSLYGLRAAAGRRRVDPRQGNPHWRRTHTARLDTGRRRRDGCVHAGRSAGRTDVRVCRSRIASSGTAGRMRSARHGLEPGSPHVWRPAHARCHGGRCGSACRPDAVQGECCLVPDDSSGRHISC